jgi:hypothetical protein
MPENAKALLRLPLPVNATGDPWKPDDKNPATVPIPNAVIMTKIEGPYTERDRKLWTFLVHAVWGDLLVKRYHEIPIAKIDKIFRELGADHNTKWLWESARRLTKTIVEWEEGPDTNRLQGISNLMNAKTSKSAQETGILWFEIPALLSEVIKQPFRFSRIRLHFMIGLSGKYAVTLYELLESAVNMKNPVLEVDLSKLRQYLKVPEGKLPRYVDVKRRILEPAVKQINDNPQGAGFTVTMDAIKEGRAVDRVRFSMTKTELRLEEENQLNRIKTEALPQKGISIKTGPPIPLPLPTSAYEKAKAAAPGYDVYYLETEWREWMKKKDKTPDNAEGAFINFCRQKAEKHPLGR